MHVHDLVNYAMDDAPHSFSHKIHALRFGPQLPDHVTTRLRNAGGGAGGIWTNHHINPLDDTAQLTNEKAFNFMYFVKVVSTAYLPLGWEKYDVPIADRDFAPLGSYGAAEQGSIETHQYSVTSHKRHLMGGRDEEEGHKERVHAHGGIPGVFFSYVSPISWSLFDLPPRKPSTALRLVLTIHTARQEANWHQDISPMKVINRETRNKSFTSFIVGVCAVVGGTLTVASAIDRAFYEGSQRIKKLHQG
jgi:endoplasmic reticulum-Golgi intermediate compartment protein 3